MENSQLKKFAAKQRELLLAQSDERSVYSGFMRLCAVAYVDREAFVQLCSAPSERPCALFAEKCRQLAEKYGGIFSLYGELPVPPLLLADGGTAGALRGLPQKIWDEPDILGRLHQYFNEPYRSEIAVGLKHSKRLSSDKIAAATQLFTPEWVVKYMLQNTLGRYLHEHGFAIDNGELEFSDVKAKKQQISPEDITIIDPCMGSGNVMLYAFDMLMELYRCLGYSDNIAAEKILSHNLYGLELDERACAVAETVLRLKAAKYGAFVKPQVYDFSGISNTAGSLLSGDELSLGSKKAAIIAQLLRKKYTIIATNPPYLGKAAMNAELSAFVQKNFADYSADLFSVFVARCMDMIEGNGYFGFLTPTTWLFLQSYEKLRRRIYSDCTLQTMIHFEYSAFEDATVPLCSFTMQQGHHGENGIYLRLTDFKGDMEYQLQKVKEALSDEKSSYRFEASAEDFCTIPSAPAAYWLGKAMFRAFDYITLGELVPVREGVITGDNDRFLRRWFEVSSDKIAFSGSQKEKWYLLNKGGEYRKWYGNREFVINWENEGSEIKDFRDENGKLRSRPQGLAYNFRPSVSWSQITSGALSVRYFNENFMFNVAGTSAFPDNERQLKLLLGLLNSKAAAEFARVLNPTMNMNPGDLARLPVPDFPEDTAEIEALTSENTALCREDWDSFETSYDFRRHPLI
ncbi:N-6 DNA methylase [Ruminococcus sp.]|uniref:Eco57I restriction-modification methylase domain-containing protein n=1 Tax=Ruminococcus sp. TaxID=41978 RepID=UPI0025FF5D82|nr:N-6 DNA methylase [Ruminococcus sp.]MCR4639610.1 N-6 DNA methylase [Ruminococcus sp.]